MRAPGSEREAEGEMDYTPKVSTQNGIFKKPAQGTKAICWLSDFYQRYIYAATRKSYGDTIGVP
eukprot:422451-Rhodomonas_salina.1